MGIYLTSTMGCHLLNRGLNNTRSYFKFQMYIDFVFFHSANILFHVSRPTPTTIRQMSPKIKRYRKPRNVLELKYGLRHQNR